MFLNTFRFLQKLNLSFNKLEGEVPSKGVFKNARSVSIIGNNKLCGGIPELHLHSCRSRGSRKLWQHSTFKIVISAVLLPCLLSTCFIVFVFYQRRKRRRRRRRSKVNSSIEDKYLKISYTELLKATEGFSSANLIGIGGYGYVYKGILGTEETNVAVKELDLQQRGASKSFIAECEALRSIRHHNLVKIITSCSSIDTRGYEFKALVYEFMPNGSLENWLNQNEDEQNQRPKLNLMQRLSIAIDVANVLEYLHHHCHTSIVHCDLKPSNVLLDNEMVAHVGDFGLPRLLHDNSPDQTSTSRVRGSIGYVAPEYGALGEVSTHGDVYGFGILLLEMFTGKRPTDDMFEEGLSLHQYTKMGLPDQVAEIIDPTILEEVLEIQADIVKELQPNLRAKFHEIQVSILRVGILCSEELPRDRMKIKDAIMELQEAQKMIQAIKL